MAGKQNEPNEKEAKAASGMKTETKPEQETETQEEKLVQASNQKGTAGNAPSKAVRQEDVYTMEEFAKNAAELFGVRKEIVVAAFYDKKVTKCTKEEAKKIVEEFKKREVK
ncbi:hypothetical protein AALB52_20705 [Lachnospiraceae bacterium 38-14]